jgi:predicted transcriptional regulator
VKVGEDIMPETTGTDPQKIDPHLTSKIVRSYVEHHTVAAGDVSELITSVHGALSQLGRPNQPEEVLTPAVPLRQSVRHNYVVCLDCGYRGKLLLRHIVKQHGFSRADYLKRWGLRKDHPLTAPDHSQQRSMMAKELGFGRKAKVVPPAAPTAPASASATLRSTAKSTQRRGPAAKSDIVNEVAIEKTPAKQRQSRPKSSRAKG